MNHTIKLFIKFGTEKNIRALYEHGTVYFNTVEYFRKIEDEELRGDKYEGATRIVNSVPGTFRLPGVNRDFKYVKVQYSQFSDQVLANVFSLYCISSKGFPNPFNFKIDRRVARFGTHCLIIKNNPYFLETIESELKSHDYEFYHGFVDYYDKESVSMNLSLFDKPIQFEYQKEFRFLVKNTTIEPIIIHVGSLEEYAEILTIEEALEMRVDS